MAVLSKTIPCVHITDLFHPPEDPDDHVDLATLYALPELDLRAVILDTSRRHLDGKPGIDYPRDPGFVPVTQLNYLTGRAIPVAAGPSDPLLHPADTAADQPSHMLAGVELLLRVLRESATPVMISVVCSARVVTAAFNRDPDLLRAKTAAILLNAGSSGSCTEHNVALDPAAYVGLWRSGLPIHWYPCSGEHGAYDTEYHNTFWQAPHADLFRNMPQPLRAWFCHSYTGNARGDIIRALEEQGFGQVWGMVMSDTRFLWSTASLVMTAGRRLSKTTDGWRFVTPQQYDPEAPSEPLSLEPVEVTVDDDAATHWTYAGPDAPHKLFSRAPDPAHGAAMAEALNALLCSLSCT